jgi:hypothetical protein
VDPFGTKIKTEDLYELKRINESQGIDAAKRWIDRNPNFTSGEKLDLHMKVWVGWDDPDEFSVLDDWFDNTTYDIGKFMGLKSYLKIHAGVKNNDPNLQAQGLFETLGHHLTFGLFGATVHHGIPAAYKGVVGFITKNFPVTKPFFNKLEAGVSKVIAFLGKPISKLFKSGDNAAKGGTNVIRTGADRTAEYGKNWKKASLKETTERIAGKNPAVEINLEKGKIILKNKETGMKVIYDQSGNYFRVLDPKLPKNIRYVSEYGNPIPANLPLIKEGRTIWSGLPPWLRRALTHFLNID